MQTRSGKSVFPIGIGTWNIASKYQFNPSEKYNGARPLYGKEEKAITAIQYSIAGGQNHIDCAEMYGGFYTDEVVGHAVASLKREDLFISDKLWRTSVEKGKVAPTVELMLKKLKTDYLDMLSIHAPWFDLDWRAAVPQINELIDQGIVRSFGVSNFNFDRLQEVVQLSAHPIVANQLNYNVLHKTEANDTLREYCNKNGITIVAYQPIKRQMVLHSDVIQHIAIAHEATAAQVALAWLLAKGALPIPKATDKQHIDENIRAVNLRLTDDDITKLDRLEITDR